MLRLAAIISILFLFSCTNKESKEVQLFYNGKVYSCDSAFTIYEAFAIKDGKFLAVGSNDELISAYGNAKKVDLNGKTVYPGLFDAHCHFYALGRLESQVNVQNTSSWLAVMDSVAQYIKRNPNLDWIVGRGWDQTVFADGKMPDKRLLDSLFPNKAILLRRVDGHAAVASQKALDAAKITSLTNIEGGEIEVVDGKLTGLIIDNSVDEVIKVIPKETSVQIAGYLLKAQEMCLKAGLTSVVDAGLSPEVLYVIDSLYTVGDLKIRINAMISADREGLAFAIKNGKIERDRFKVSSFKIYGDGALGSRGALLKKPYCDRKNHQGMLLTPVDTINMYCDWAAKNGFQVCTHAIGDSANKLLLNIYGKYTIYKDLRWRIEHAQVVELKDHELFKSFGIIPSIQPTHATSDMRWAEQRLCTERLAGAYAYQSLLQSYGKVALGTDFPIEDYKPNKTFYAAVYRQDAKGFPTEGFQKQNALTPKQALLGMTTWAAFAQFDESRLGQIANGYEADFVVSNIDWLDCDKAELLPWIPYLVFVKGERLE